MDYEWDVPLLTHNIYYFTVPQVSCKVRAPDSFLYYMIAYLEFFLFQFISYGDLKLYELNY